jgi:hypothetical protein
MIKADRVADAGGGWLAGWLWWQVCSNRWPLLATRRADLHEGCVIPGFVVNLKGGLDWPVRPKMAKYQSFVQVSHLYRSPAWPYNSRFHPVFPVGRNFHCLQPPWKVAIYTRLWRAISRRRGCLTGWKWLGYPYSVISGETERCNMLWRKR